MLRTICLATSACSGMGIVEFAFKFGPMHMRFVFTSVAQILDGIFCLNKLLQVHARAVVMTNQSQPFQLTALCITSSAFGTDDASLCLVERGSKHVCAFSESISKVLPDSSATATKLSLSVAVGSDWGSSSLQMMQTRGITQTFFECLGPFIPFMVLSE